MLSVIRYNSSVGKKRIKKILLRSQTDYSGVQKTVDDILYNVKKLGDNALFEYTLKLDKASLDATSVRVSGEEIKKAYAAVSEDFLRVIKRSAERVRDFHRKQRQNSWFEPSENGEILGQLLRPVESAGVYVPGGKAAYPSSVLMNIIPAQIAGVKRIVMVTPPNSSGEVYPVSVVAAVEAGVTEIYKAGGAQAIAALAFGTESIPKVDKIVGPGNIYVALAKKSVYGHVSIDSVAGPSEILIIADKTANPAYVAADLLSQAEHDEMASAILLTENQKLAEEVVVELKKQSELLSRKDIIKKSLNEYGAIVITESISEAVELSNKIAPEHLELCVAEPFELLPQIKNAGAIFMGSYTPEPLGDYMAGPNHVLPTGGTARFFSPLCVDDFIKKSSVLSFSKQALLDLGDDVITFAEAEGLTAHANSIRVRMNEEFD